MTFAAFSPLVMVLGAMAITASLFALQQLRVRHKIVRLPAAMLWAQAMREVPARALREKFRYWPAFLLALAIALALWSAAGLPRLSVTDRADYTVFYIDNSAALSCEGALASARRAMMADVAALAPDRREVRLGNAEASLLLAPGENVALLAHRLDAMQPQLRPSAFPRWLANAPAGATIRYYGSGEAARQAQARASRGNITLAYGYLAPAVPENRGIVELGVTPAATGAWDKADLLVEVAGGQGSAVQADDLAFTRNGKAFAPALLPGSRPGKVLVAGLDADGAIIGVTLRRGDRFPADDSAAVRLPDHRRIPVALAPGIPQAIRAVVAADPALVAAPHDQARVIVRSASDPADPRLPELVLRPAADGIDSFVFAWPDQEDAQDPSPLTATGLDRLDLGALAGRLNHPVTLGLQTAPRRSAAVWTEIFAQADFARSADMPLFVSRTLRWLAGPEPWVASAKADAPVLSAFEQAGPAPGRDTDALDDADILPAAGKALLGALPVQVSLLDRATTLGAGRSADQPLSHPAGALLADWPFLLLCLIAGLLLIIEWRFYRTGRMP